MCIGMADCGANNVTTYMGKADRDKSRLPNSTAECGFCEEGFRFDDHREECVLCSTQITCRYSLVKRSPCHDMTQYFDHAEGKCIACPQNFICEDNREPKPQRQYDPQTREELQTFKKILLPYWIDESNDISKPFGKECFSKRKDDRRADCDVSISVRHTRISVRHTCIYVRHT